MFISGHAFLLEACIRQYRYADLLAQQNGCLYTSVRPYTHLRQYVPRGRTLSYQITSLSFHSRLSAPGGARYLHLRRMPHKYASERIRCDIEGSLRRRATGEKCRCAKRTEQQGFRRGCPKAGYDLNGRQHFIHLWVLTHLHPPQRKMCYREKSLKTLLVNTWII